jgi:multidrug efflux pump subunit AcrA (membrane-fusion protein)
MKRRTARGGVRLIVLLALAAAIGTAVFFAVRSFARPQVQVTHTVQADVVQAFYATGTIVPEREYPLRAQVAGVLALEPGIDKGGAVTKGQLVGRVISDDLEKKFKQAEAELKEKQIRADEKQSPVLREFDKRIEAYQAMLDIVGRELTRLGKLDETGSARQIEIDRAQDKQKTVWAELEAAKAQRDAKLLELKKDLQIAESNLGIARWNVDQQELRSPVEGVVLDWPTPNRTRVAINDHVMLVADVRPATLVMRAAVDEEDKAKLFVGQAVRMTLYSFPNDKFEGRVKTVYAKADPQRRTFEVDVEITRPQIASTAPATGPTTRSLPHDRFAPGMTGELAFVEHEKPVATILPRQALQGEWFYVVRGGKIERVPAQAGIRNVTRVEVLDGVSPDEQVMISPVGKLQIGQAVRVTQVDPRIAADINRPKEVEIFRGGF